MKTISNELKSHLEQDLTTLATCWLIQLTNGDIKAFTDADKDIEFEGFNYISIAGFTPTSVEAKGNLAVDNLDIQAGLHSNHITAPDLLAGKYDYAEVLIFSLNYADLSQGKMILKRGRIGEVSLQKDSFTAELRGLSENIQKNIGQLYSKSCRADLGDSRCKANLSAFTFADNVAEVVNNITFRTNNLTQNAGYFTGGEVEFTSGSNQGLRMEVKEFTENFIILALPMPYEIQVGDNIKAIAGCDKSLDSCKNKFSNIINFRGEPHIPTTDAII